MFAGVEDVEGLLAIAGSFDACSARER